jgi:hypothetical protein
VEALVLNARPFPEVLEAITENESFRSLRYVSFGANDWAWAPTYPDRLRFITLASKLSRANQRHVPHGEMRGVLRAILRDTPVVPAAAAPAPVPLPLRMPEWATGSEPPSPLRALNYRVVLWVCLAIPLLLGYVMLTNRSGNSTTAPTKLDYTPDRHRIPPVVSDAEKRIKPSVFDPRRKPPAAMPDPGELPPNFVGPPRPTQERKK